jgi:hypothetical protein
MTPHKLSPVHAQRVVEARLGREPQDMLEAAVALEAWAGLRALDALGTGRDLMRASRREAQPSIGKLPLPDAQEGLAVEAAAFVVVVISIACWAAPLATTLGAGVVEHGLMVALPLTLALQWWLRSRYLGRPKGLAQLGRRPLMMLLATIALVGLPSAVMGLSGTVAGLLTVTWTGGTILIRRRWSLGYAAAVVLATAGMLAGLSALAVLAGIAVATALAVAVAVRSSVTLAGHPPGRMGRAVTAGIIGAGMGVVLVADRSVDWSVGAVPAIALIPSTVASFWGGYHLWQFQYVIPKALSGVAIFNANHRGLGWPPLRILLGAVGRLVLLTAVLSAVLLLGASALGMATSGVSVLVGFGLVALATLLVSLLESVGRASWALLSVLCAIAGEAYVRMQDIDPFPGVGLIVGASLAVLVALPAAIGMMSRPARTLATALWIS